MPVPVSLTEGLPKPEMMEKQKAQYEVALKGQLDKQSKAVIEEAEIQKKMMQATAKQQLEQYKLQVEEQVAMAMMQIDQQAQNTCAGLKEAAITQQTAMEEKAALAIMEYKKTFAIQEMAKKSAALQQGYYEQEMKLAKDYEQAMKKGWAAGVVTPAIPTAPVPAVI